MNLIEQLEAEQIAALGKTIPDFKAGDTITVYYEIREGEKNRTQHIRGTEIQRRGAGASETFTIRKMSGTVGVERIFPLNLPAIEKIEDLIPFHNIPNIEFYHNIDADELVEIIQPVSASQTHWHPDNPGYFCAPGYQLNPSCSRAARCLRAPSRALHHGRRSLDGSLRPAGAPRC